MAVQDTVAVEPEAAEGKVPVVVMPVARRAQMEVQEKNGLHLLEHITRQAAAGVHTEPQAAELVEPAAEEMVEQETLLALTAL